MMFLFRMVPIVTSPPFTAALSIAAVDADKNCIDDGPTSLV